MNITLLLVLLMVVYASATLGGDISQSFSISDFKCLKSKGYSFMVVRCYQSLNRADPNCPASVEHAWAAGMAHVDLYMFPCPKCGDPAGQVNRLISFINEHHIKYGMLWFDIEEPSYWHSSSSANVEFLRTMINTARAHGINVGIYTSRYQWDIMGQTHAFASIPLWYAHWDGETSFRDFSSFGGWTRPAIKQFSDKSVAGCSNNGLDKNFY